MTPNLKMEQRSLAVIRAVAADAGYQVVTPEPDVDSVDGVLMASFGRRPRIEFQAKSTARDINTGRRPALPAANQELRRIALGELDSAYLGSRFDAEFIRAVAVANR